MSKLEPMAGLGEAVEGRLKSLVSPKRRRQVTFARLAVRSATAGRRTYPDLLVIGAQRCGTSTLYKLLGRHPLAFPSLRKEVEFFSTSFCQGTDWYRGHFPLMARVASVEKRNRHRSVSFEVTPDYLHDPRAPQRAFDLVPESRILVMVRDPVDRAYSQYLHNRRLGQEPLEFEAALAAEPERLSGEVDRMLEDPCYPARRFRRYSYVSRGLYSEQIRRWLDLFPPEQIHVISSEDFFDRPAEVFAEVVRFLDLPDWSPSSYANHSYPGSSKPVKETMDPSTKEWLDDLFVEANSSLPDLLRTQLAMEGLPSWSLRHGGHRAE